MPKKIKSYPKPYVGLGNVTALVNNLKETLGSDIESWVNIERGLDGSVTKVEFAVPIDTTDET